MNTRMKVGTVRGWDIGSAVAIVTVVFLGWLTAPGGNGAAPHSRLVGPAPSMTRPALSHVNERKPR
jgi:hypothetical protein